VDHKLPPDPRIGTVLSGRYRIDQLIGEGGMGKVYAAEHVAMHKRLALKVLHRELSVVPELVTRFEREAMAAANIDHPNVASATDFGKLDDDSVFIALELVEGRCLRDVIAAGPIPVRRALGIARQIASALAAAHALSIVHRDLKPENVMLVERNVDPDFVKVLDFGVAKVPIGEAGGAGPGVLTRIGTVFGTPEYIPPEQALGQPSDGRADLYSLGVILYEMLTGVRPFTSTSKVNLVGMHLSEPAPKLEDRAPGQGFPDALEALVASLLKKSAAERPARAEDVVKTIDEILAHPLHQPWRPRGNGALAWVAARYADARSHLRPLLAQSGPLVARAREGLAPLLVGLRAAFGRTVGAIERIRGNLPPAVTKRIERVSSTTFAKILVGFASFVLLLAVVGIVGTLRKPREVLAPPAASSARTESTSPAASSASADASASAAPGASAAPSPSGSASATPTLETLLDQAKSRANAKDFVGAVDAAKAALAQNPAAKDDARLGAALFQAAQDKKASDAAFALLEGPLQDKGAGVLHDLAVFAPKGTAAQRRAESWLGSPAFNAVATPALKLAVAMRRARTCKEVRALLPEVKAKGDKQSLPYLKFFHDHLSSYPCLRGDNLLADTNSAVSARAAKLDAPAP
jgi:serine/threonine-protein kinase